MDIKKELQSLIEENKIDEVIEKLKGYFGEKEKNDKLYNDVILMSSRWNEVKDIEFNDTKDRSYIDVQKNRIKKIFIHLIGKIEQKSPEQPDTITHEIEEANQRIERLKKAQSLSYFVNRNKELTTLLDVAVPQMNFIIEAPSGYGKTFLLRDKLEFRIRQQNETHDKPKSKLFYIKLSEDNDFEKKIRNKIKTGQTQNDYITDFCSKLMELNNRNQEPVAKFYVVIDNCHYLSVSQSLKERVETFIEKTIENREYEDYHLYFILSGRKVDIRYFIFNQKQKEIELTHFNTDIIAKAVKRFMKECGLDPESTNQMKFLRDSRICEKLATVTGGHPEAIINILKQEIKPTHFVFSAVRNKLIHHQNLIKQYSQPVIDKILKGIDKKTHDSFGQKAIKSLLFIITVFRVFNKETIKVIKTSLYEKTKNDAPEVLPVLRRHSDFDLSIFKEERGTIYSVLKKTFLFKSQEKSTLLGDSIVRQLFIQCLKTQYIDIFNELNNFAIEMYKNWITDEVKRNDVTRTNLCIYLTEYVLHCYLKDISSDFETIIQTAFGYETLPRGEHQEIITDTLECLKNDKDHDICQLLRKHNNTDFVEIIDNYLKIIND